MSFKDYLSEAKVTGAYKSQAFTKFVELINKHLEEYKSRTIEEFKVDTKNRGGHGGWGNKIRRVNVTVKITSDSPKISFIIDEQNEMSLAKYDKRRGEWVDVVFGEKLEQNTYRQDITKFGKGISKFVGDDPSGEILKFIDATIVFPDKKEVERIRKLFDKKIDKQIEGLSELRSLYHENRESFYKNFKYDAKGNAIYIIGELIKELTKIKDIHNSR